MRAYNVTIVFEDGISWSAQYLKGRTKMEVLNAYLETVPAEKQEHIISVTVVGV